MSEVIKLYENAGVEKSKCWDDCNTCTRTSCDKNISYVKADYPPFTAEKQIELIKLLAKRIIKIDNTDGEYEFSIFDAVSDFSSLEESSADTVSDFNSFEESLADLTNRLWQNLTEEERKQVKEILE